MPTGIDCLSLIAGRREAELAGRRIDYAALPGLDAPEDADHEEQQTIDRLRAHHGRRMPFGKDLTPGALQAHRSHAEAVARITWCIGERAIGAITGECGSGKTVAARAAVAALDASRHTVVYLGTPGVGLRGMYARDRRRPGRHPPLPLRLAHPPPPRIFHLTRVRAGGGVWPETLVVVED